MRFGISATSSIFPKNFLTRFRPINVCAIMSSRSIEPSGSNRRQPTPSAQTITLAPQGQKPRDSRHRGDQDDSPEGRNPSRPSGQASHAYFALHFPAIRSKFRIARNCARLRLSESPGLAPLARGFPLNKHCLLKLNLCADLFEGRLDLGSLVLVDAFLDVLRRAFAQLLSLFQAEPGDCAHFLDDLDLLLASSSENDRKFGLFLSRRRRRRGRTSRNRNCGGSRNAPLLFE